MKNIYEKKGEIVQSNSEFENRKDNNTNKLYSGNRLQFTIGIFINE